MKELKTLKDLPDRITGVCVNVKDLRQEAIKWVKELSVEIEQIKRIPEVYIEFKKNPILIKEEVCHTIRWIKFFFNLTKEDLK